MFPSSADITAVAVVAAPVILLTALIGEVAEILDFIGIILPITNFTYKTTPSSESRKFHDVNTIGSTPSMFLKFLVTSQSKVNRILIIFCILEYLLYDGTRSLEWDDCREHFFYDGARYLEWDACRKHLLYSGTRSIERDACRENLLYDGTRSLEWDF